MAGGEIKCSDCGGEMVEGFILDTSFASQRVVRWFGGQPQKDLLGSVKTKRMECRSVQTYRCVACGLLKSYATTKIDPDNESTP